MPGPPGSIAGRAAAGPGQPRRGGVAGVDRGEPALVRAACRRQDDREVAAEAPMRASPAWCRRPRAATGVPAPAASVREVGRDGRRRAARAPSGRRARCGRGRRRRRGRRDDRGKDARAVAVGRRRRRASRRAGRRTMTVRRRDGGAGTGVTGRSATAAGRRPDRSRRRRAGGAVGVGIAVGRLGDRSVTVDGRRCWPTGPWSRPGRSASAEPTAVAAGCSVVGGRVGRRRGARRPWPAPGARGRSGAR